MERLLCASGEALYLSEVGMVVLGWFVQLMQVSQPSPVCNEIGAFVSLQMNMNRILRGVLVSGLVMALGLCGGMQAQTFAGPRGVQVESVMRTDAQALWTLLLDFADYPNWNPYIRSIQGMAKKGKKLHIQIDGKEKDYDFKAKVLELEENQRFAWGGSALFFFKARHYFRIEPLGGGQVKFTQGEAWGGLFGKSYGKKVYEEAAVNFEKMNAKMALMLEGQQAVPK